MTLHWTSMTPESDSESRRLFFCSFFALLMIGLSSRNENAAGDKERAGGRIIQKRRFAKVAIQKMV